MLLSTTEALPGFPSTPLCTTESVVRSREWCTFKQSIFATIAVILVGVIEWREGKGHELRCLQKENRALERQSA